MTYKKAMGRREFLRSLEGVKLSFKQACIAKCYDCMSYYEDGKVDCLITDCPLYLFMPYRENGVK